MPLHIFISTAVGSALGVLPAAKVAKDVVLVAGLLLALAASASQKWFKPLLRDKLVWLIVAYVVLTLTLALFKPTDADAEILGVVYNTRFLIFFLYGWLLTHLFDGQHVRRIALKTVMGVGVLVALFGVVQYTVLPDDALSRVGYSRENGVLPAFFIDDKPDLERVMSTVRDPNSLGSYLIIIASIAAVYAYKFRGDRKLLPLGILLLAALCLLLTFSRSAWAGFALAMCVLAAGLAFGQKSRFKPYKPWAISGLVLILALAGGLIAARNTYFVKNVIFHADESTVLEDPNELRLRFWQESVEDIVANPVGSGPGTAGLASIKNEVQGTVLNENYYLQIANEIGVLGLLIFLAILVMVGARVLAAIGQSPAALGLFAAFIGLAFTNLLVHIWSNETVAYTWWGLAGLAIGWNRTDTKSEGRRAIIAR